MRVNGKVLSGPRTVSLYVPITDEQVVEFKFRCLKDDEDFEKVVKKPKPPEQLRPGGVTFIDHENPRYKAALTQWVEDKFNWEFIKSVSATLDLHWEFVKDEDPLTCKNWRTEVAQTLGSAVVERLFGCFLSAQYLTEEDISRARERFLSGQQDQTLS